jgi:hypothetical protein
MADMQLGKYDLSDAEKAAFWKNLRDIGRAEVVLSEPNTQFACLP